MLDLPGRTVHWGVGHGLVFIKRPLCVVTMGWSAVKNRVAELAIPMRSAEGEAGKIIEG